MLKKLDKLILKAFVGPFIATFFVTLFVLVLQFFWKYIDDLVGKGLGMGDIAYLTGLVTLTWIPLALPLAILLSSIMTFGNLGESYELVAIKSSGIPLLRFMRPLFLISLILCGIAFMFANYVLPVASLKFTTFLYDITYSQPAFDLKEGVFYNKLDGYSIKVGKKDKDGSTIHDVIIYDKQYSLQDDIIMAESGKMSVTPDRKFLEFRLNNGIMYQEKGPSYSTNTNFYRIGFKEYKMVFDLSKFELMNTSDSNFMTQPKMLNVRQLDKALDSLKLANKTTIEERMEKEVSSYFSFSRIPDSLWKKPVQPFSAQGSKYRESIPDSLRQTIMASTTDRFSAVKNSTDVLAQVYKDFWKFNNNHLVEWHRKFSLSLACLVLFLIGAPLGSIIRKGGLGMPLVIAVIFFMIFHLLNMFGEKFAKQEIMVTGWGMWLANLILIPIGIFLIFKAMRDSQLFNMEAYYRLLRPVREAYLNRRAKKSKTEMV